MDPASAAAAIPAALTLVFRTVFFSLDVADAPESVRWHLKLVRSWQDCLEQLITVRNRHKNSLPQDKLEAIDRLINSLHKDIQEVYDIFEPCCKPGPYGDTVNMGLLGRLQWELFNSQAFERVIPSLKASVATAQHEISRIYHNPAVPPHVAEDEQESGDGQPVDISPCARTLGPEAASPQKSRQPTPVPKKESILRRAFSPMSARKKSAKSTSAAVPQPSSNPLIEVLQGTMRRNVVTRDEDDPVSIGAFPIVVAQSTEGGDTDTVDAASPRAPAPDCVPSLALAQGLPENGAPPDLGTNELCLLLPVPSLQPDTAPSDALNPDLAPSLIPIQQPIIPLPIIPLPGPITGALEL